MHGAKFDERVIDAAVAGLGALPTSVSSLAAVTGSPNFDFADVVDVVERDMVLAGGVLRAANSAESASTVRVETVRDAVVRIGPARTLAAAMHTVVGGQLQTALAAYAIEPGELGRHSSGAWIAADLIRTRVRASVQLPTSVGTTALLHDVGKLVCNTLADDSLLHAVFADAVGEQLCALERSVVGIDHAGMGSIVAARWNLPPAIVAGIRDHHDTIDDPIAIAVAVADDVSHAVTEASFRDEGETVRRALYLGMPAGALLEIVEETAKRLDAFESGTASSPT